MALSRLLARLKESTAALHREAECYVRILDRDATAVDYQRYLVAMHGFHASIEPQFEAHRDLAVTGFAPETRRKTGWLDADLRALAARERARCELPALGSLSRAIGAAYVIEGSTLGGRFILAKLPPAIAACGATRFLEGYGGQTGAQWRRFAEVTMHAPDDDEAIAGARETFEQLIAWLARFEVRLAEAS